MTIRWRLVILFMQLAILSVFTRIVTGNFYSSETWFVAGLLAVIINPQLLEPFYRKPQDVIANSVIFFFLYLSSKKEITEIGWKAFAVFMGFAFIFAITAVVFGANKREGKFVGIARASNMLTQLAASAIVYSVIFILSLIEQYPQLGNAFWILIIGWSTILILGKVNWQSVFSAASGKSLPSKVEGMIGPNILLISATSLPIPGTHINIENNATRKTGIVLNRIRRLSEAWGQIHMASQIDCEEILDNPFVRISTSFKSDDDIVGAVDVGSSDYTLKFVSTQPLEVGAVVGVPLLDIGKKIIYQLSAAFVEKSDTKGGAHLIVRASANQLGIFDYESMNFIKHRWTPTAGAPVLRKGFFDTSAAHSYPDDQFLLGHVIGTEIPIFLNCDSATEGHLAILGMTKMGKSTLAERLAKELSKTRRVTILDQTGEYVNKKGFKASDMDVDWSTPGISVFEPKPGEIPANRALDFLQYIIDLALKEYKKDEIIKRTVIIDEAHQFIPEPAGLGFNAPGRDSSYKIGLLMMQIRKYGISIILISQRTAVVAKSALSQCENIIAFRSVDQTGLDYLEAVAGNEIRTLLPQLRQGESLVFGPAISSDTAIGIKVLKPTTAT